MATASAAFTFSGCTSLAKKTASASASISATLDSLSGVSTVTWSVYSTDETTTPGDYTLVTSGPKGSTVTFTTGAAGTAGLLQCVVNGGLNPQTGAAEAAYTKRAKWCVLTAASNLEVGCVDEAFESDPTFGSTGIVNGAIRAVTAAVGVTSVSGSAPISSSGGATPTISISAASGGAAGSMSAAHYALVDGATDTATASTLVKRDASSVTKLAALELGATPATSLGQVRTSPGNVLSAKIGPSGEDRTILSTSNEHIYLGSTYGDVNAQITNGSTKFSVVDPLVIGSAAISAEIGHGGISLNKLVRLYGGATTHASAEGHIGWDATSHRPTIYDGSEKPLLAAGDVAGAGTSVGLYSARPAAGTSGAVYVPTDGPIAAIDNGAEWLPLIPGGGVGKTPSLATAWTSLGVGAPTIADAAGTLRINASNGGVGPTHKFQGYRKSSPAGGYAATYAASMLASPGGAGPVFSSWFLLGWQESTSSRIVAYAQAVYDVGESIVMYWDSPNALSATAAGAPIKRSSQWLSGSPCIWVRFSDDNINTLRFELSTNGLDWIEFYSETYATFLGAKPDRIVLGLDCYGNAASAIMRILSEVVA